MDPNGLRVEGIAIAGSALAGTRVVQARAPGALFIHGWSGGRSDMAGPMAEAAASGFACLDYDLRGHGATAEQRAAVTLQRSVDDAVHAWDALAAMPGVDAGETAVVGTSFGGWLACLVSAARPVRWLVLRVPALYPDRWWERPKEGFDADALAAYRRQGPGPETDRALAACAAFEGEVLLAWSGRDEVLPRGLADSFQVAFPKACSLTVRCLRDADHGLTDAASRAEYRALLGGWLRTSLLARRRREVEPLLESDPA
ncbi:alpha/beta hydrolase family protein [Pseudoxanthomonas sp. 10H]|uniref:alpha/beta hydrolase family protein n=1 Tax=Pseudoxanthomonas sp. 10H TaxID=3242729 RepID=UPI003558A6E0